MKLTNTKTNKYDFVGDTTIEILNYLAAKGLVAHTEDNKQGYFYCTLKEMAEKFDVSVTTINYHVNRLRSLKVIEIRIGGCKKSIYKVNPFKVSDI